ncbi:MAG TPA: hypothetical protein VL294_00315 [Pseudolysinimonas sp.]|jgi:hypothetical protein|nr:hypothetical protein [Pseudolysinimonas sp.]
MSLFPALPDEAFLSWHALKDDVEPYIGERAVSLFCYAVSEAAGGAGPAQHFRRILVDSGDDPDDPVVTETEQLLLHWGRLIATTPHAIPADVAARVEAAFSPALRMLLVAFAGQVIAMNLVAIVGGAAIEDEPPGDGR